MTEQFDNTLVTEIDGKPKRPQFLKVLCILSFVACGLIIGIMPLSIYFNSEEKVIERIEMLKETAPSMAQQVENDYYAQKDTVWYKIQYYVIILYELVVLLTVVMMWNLKRLGFYLYSALELLPYIGLLFSEGSSVEIGEGGKAAGVIFMVIVVILDLTFVVMYGLNLKHMKKSN